MSMDQEMKEIQDRLLDQEMKKIKGPGTVIQGRRPEMKLPEDEKAADPEMHKTNLDLYKEARQKSNLQYQLKKAQDLLWEAMTILRRLNP